MCHRYIELYMVRVCSQVKKNCLSNLNGQGSVQPSWEHRHLFVGMRACGVDVSAVGIPNIDFSHTEHIHIPSPAENPDCSLSEQGTTTAV